MELGFVKIRTQMEQVLILLHIILLERLTIIALLKLPCRLLNIMGRLRILEAIFGENLLKILIPMI